MRERQVRRRRNAHTLVFVTGCNSKFLFLNYANYLTSKSIDSYQNALTLHLTIACYQKNCEMPETAVYETDVIKIRS